jgi:hypothetical protein
MTIACCHIPLARPADHQNGLAGPAPPAPQSWGEPDPGRGPARGSSQHPGKPPSIGGLGGQSAGNRTPPYRRELDGPFAGSVRDIRHGPAAPTAS